MCSHPQPLCQASACSLSSSLAPQGEAGSPPIVWSQPPSQKDKRKTAERFFMQPSAFLVLVPYHSQILQKQQRHGALWEKHEQLSQAGWVQCPAPPSGNPQGALQPGERAFNTDQVTSTVPCCKDLVRENMPGSNGSSFGLTTVVIPAICVWFTDYKTVSQSTGKLPVSLVLFPGLHLGRRK